jgi:dipeptide/tripeptide permease
MVTWLTNVNWLAVIVATAIEMALGFIWYHERVLGAAWMKEIGKTRDQLGQPGPAMGLMVVAALIEAYALAVFMSLSGTASLRGALLRGLLVGLGFVATTMAGENIFAGRSRKLYLITAGYNVVSILLMSLVYGLWR